MPPFKPKKHTTDHFRDQAAAIREKLDKKKFIQKHKKQVPVAPGVSRRARGPHRKSSAI